MHVVTVVFEVDAKHADDFHRAMQQQASNSLAREPGCKRFDVCVDPKSPARVFLYEVYDDEPAFQAHLESRHYAAFSETIEPWLVSKSVRTWWLD